MKVTIGTPATPTCLPTKKSCNKCGETFANNFEFENHMVQVHGLDKTHACEICGKRFYLKWRMNKHRNTHGGSRKPCKFFQDGNVCPFNEVGCKFVHEETDTVDNEEKMEHGCEDPDAVTIVEPDDTVGENQCHLCMKDFDSKDSLFDHFETDHYNFYSCMVNYRKENQL